MTTIVRNVPTSRPVAAAMPNGLMRSRPTAISNTRGVSPRTVETVVISSQHAKDISLDGMLAPDLRKHVLEVVLDEFGFDAENVRFLVNPTGKFEIGGPMGDAGLTGRKIIVDTYGGMARHGGGAFSGKDPSKVDRSACYMARYIAKNLVAAGLATRAEVQLAYAIGVADPVSVMVNTFGTGRIPDPQFTALVREHFPLTPLGIIEHLKLRRPIYRATAAFGHFGRSGDGFTWELTDKADALRQAAGALAEAATR